MTEHAFREPGLGSDPTLCAPLGLDDEFQTGGAVVFFHEDTLSRSVETVKYTVAVDELSFGRWLQRQLDRRQWSQADLVRAGGFSRSAVSEWVRGGRVPDPASCDLIADPVYGEFGTGWYCPALSPRFDESWHAVVCWLACSRAQNGPEVRTLVDAPEPMLRAR